MWTIRAHPKPLLKHTALLLENLGYVFIISAVTVFEAKPKRAGDKRKKEKNWDSSDVDGYLGPWAKYADEKTVMKPSEVRIILHLRRC